MKITSFLKNLMTIMFSNGILLVSQVFVGILLPRILYVSDFGNYRIFMLYCTYASLLHFGFVDGVLVKYGGVNSSTLKKGELSQLFSFFICLEIIISIIIMTTSLFALNGKYKIIFVAVGIYTVIFNVVTFFQFLSQALMKFGMVARINSALAVLNTFNIGIPLIFLHFYIIKEFTYCDYLVLYLTSYIIILFIYIYSFTVKERIVWFTLKFNKKSIINIFKIGFPITVASQIANVTLNLDNQFVSLFFSTDNFAKYSFSYNLISLTISIVLAISTVLFPYLNRQNRKTLIHNYTQNMAFMLLFIYLTLISYYPIEWIIKFILPEYYDSLGYFRILLPGVAITTSITTIIFNHYKVTGEMNTYLKNGIISLLLSLVLYFVSYEQFHSIYALAFASLIALFIWFFLEDYSFRKRHNIIRFNEYTYIILVTSFFQLVTFIFNNLASFILYLLGYVFLSYLFERQYLNKALVIIRHLVS
ncbi:oligosaccharide flippase family protein [Limosilactobacillus frumenti]|uniref:oligosaccharide flippase family protein n=1 Tax=Limosilactobacillus frumenti TaxID=104955 RepID=UPI000710CD57|nr:oligosaccharide flippase family protein [Limosilactobacillus frumenti]